MPAHVSLVSPVPHTWPSPSWVTFTSRSLGSLCNLIQAAPHNTLHGRQSQGDTRLPSSLLYICHLYSPLCSSHLCMHQLFPIEPTIEMEIILTSQWLKGNNFLLSKALLSFLLFLRESDGCVALFTTVLRATLNLEDMEPLIQQRQYKSQSARKNQDNTSGKWGWSWRQCTVGFSSCCVPPYWFPVSGFH